MTSVLKVDNIQNSSGTNALSIDSSGRILTPARPAFAARTSATTGATSTVKFGTEIFDHGGNYDTTNYRFTAPIAGLYFFEVHVLTERSTAIYEVSIDLEKNGTIFERLYSAKGDASNHHLEIRGSTLVELAANDYVDVYNNSSRSIITSDKHCIFNGYLIG